jgi:hypothetical protein
MPSPDGRAMPLGEAELAWIAWWDGQGPQSHRVADWVVPQVSAPVRGRLLRVAMRRVGHTPAK